MSGPITFGYYLVKLVPDYKLVNISHPLFEAIFPLHMEHFSPLQLKHHIQRKDKQ